MADDQDNQAPDTQPGSNPVASNASPGAGPQGGLPAMVAPSSAPPPAGFSAPAPATKAGPGVLRSILGTFLTGLESGLSAGPGPLGPSKAAAGGAQAMDKSALNPKNQPQVQFDSTMRKAQLALMQINLQRQIALFHQDEPLMQNAKLQAWIKNGAMFQENAAKGNGEILFTTSPDQTADEAFAALNNEWIAQIKKGNYDIAPYATGDPSKPTLGLYAFKNSTWQGGDIWRTANPDDPSKPIETKIPDGVKAAGAKAVQAWGLTVDNRYAKSQLADKANAAKAANTAAVIAGRNSVVKLQIAGENWRAQLHEQNANGRAALAQANKSGDAQYINVVKSYQREVDLADKWSQDNKMSSALGWKDNPYSGSVEALGKLVQDYEAAHPGVMQPATGAKSGAKKPAYQKDGKWFDAQTNQPIEVK